MIFNCNKGRVNSFRIVKRYAFFPTTLQDGSVIFWQEYFVVQLHSGRFHGFTDDGAYALREAAVGKIKKRLKEDPCDAPPGEATLENYWDQS